MGGIWFWRPGDSLTRRGGRRAGSRARSLLPHGVRTRRAYQAVSVVTFCAAVWHNLRIKKDEHMKRLLVAGVIMVGCVGRGHAGDLTLWYDKPANKGMNEALPIGNGKFGGLVYAGPKQERVVLNEISQWTGTEISSDDYSKMGSYQMLGELLVNVAPDAATGAVAAPTFVCASEHKAFFETEEIGASVDGDPGTKWCVQHKGKPVI